jgi:hypothetical protein
MNKTRWKLSDRRTELCSTLPKDMRYKIYAYTRSERVSVKKKRGESLYNRKAIMQIQKIKLIISIDMLLFTSCYNNNTNPTKFQQDFFFIINIVILISRITLTYIIILFSLWIKKCASRMLWSRIHETLWLAVILSAVIFCQSVNLHDFCIRQISICLTTVEYQLWYM